MLSQAGRRYQTSKNANIHFQIKKQRVFNKFLLKYDKPKKKKVKPFDTISRQIKTSYIIRMTKDSNTEVNCYPKYNAVFKINKRPTIDHASFIRKIGDVKDQDYSVDITNLSQKCLRSHSNPAAQILNKQTPNWRKSTINFSKQLSTKRLSLPQKIKTQESTNDNFMKTLKQITESNFNNYQRFQFKPKKNNCLNFKTYKSHNYLAQTKKPTRQRQKCYTQSNEGFIKASMGKAKGQTRFFLFKQKIATRFDKMDRNWNCHLDYDVKDTKHHHSIDISKVSNRKENAIFSKYPIRISLCNHLNIKP